MADTWLQSESGAELDLTDPHPTAIHWPDIASALGKTCRFGGHCKRFYSVAEHCCRVADLLPGDLRIYGLLHDAHEAWTGDIVHPVKMLLGPEITALEERIDSAIYGRAGITPPSPAVIAQVKIADLRMLATERRDLMPPPARPWAILEGVQPDDIPISAWHWAAAGKIWLHELQRCLLMSR